MFFLVFISHYVFNTINTIYNNDNTEIVLNLEDFDSEEENNESENEVKELDEYLHHSYCNVTPSSLLFSKRLHVSPVFPKQFKEVDSPPPIS